MDWYVIIGAIILLGSIVSSLWGGWRLWKHIPREVGEALIEIADAMEDDRLTLDEIRAITARYHRIIKAVSQATGRHKKQQR